MAEAYSPMARPNSKMAAVFMFLLTLTLVDDYRRVLGVLPSGIYTRPPPRRPPLCENCRRRYLLVCITPTQLPRDVSAVRQDTVSGGSQKKYINTGLPCLLRVLGSLASRSLKIFSHFLFIFPSLKSTFHSFFFLCINLRGTSYSNNFDF